MKKLLVAAVACALLVPGSPSAALKVKNIKFQYAGLGGQLGLKTGDDTHPVDVGFRMALHGDIAFSLGHYGELHYFPSFAFWFGNASEFDIDYSAREFQFNFFDFRYSFPIPWEWSFRPFVGLGPMVAIQRSENTEYPPIVSAERTVHSKYTRGGLNVFAGSDLQIKDNLILFAEFRGKVDHWDEFQVSLGITYAVAGSR